MLPESHALPPTSPPASLPHHCYSSARTWANPTPSHTTPVHPLLPAACDTSRWNSHHSYLSSPHQIAKCLTRLDTQKSPPAQRPKHLQSRPADQCLYALAAGSVYKCQHQWIQGGKSLHRSHSVLISLLLTMAAAISSGLSPSRSNRNVTILLL